MIVYYTTVCREKISAPCFHVLGEKKEQSWILTLALSLLSLDGSHALLALSSLDYSACQYVYV